MWMTLRGLGWTPAAEIQSIDYSPPVRVSFTHGRKSSLAALISNPRFYELMMGWPIGWSDPAAPVTGFAVWLLRSRGELSRLLTSPIWAPDDREAG